MPEAQRLTLHRIWIGADPPADYIDNLQTWREVNPGIEVVEWDEDAIDAFGLENRRQWDEAPDIQPSRLVPRLRSDIARYEILWRFGGFYADHDFRARRPIGPHIAHLPCFAVAEKPGLIANGLMGCVPGHPFMRLLIDELPQSIRKQPSQQTWRMAGPGFITRMAKGRGDLTVLPSRLFLPYHHSEIGHESVPDDAVLEHTWGSARGQVSVIIPWRGGDPDRGKALDVVRRRYEVHRDWQIVVATHDGGEFNKAAAVNAGVARSFGDVLVIADADLLCEGVEDAVAQVRAGARWVMPYSMLYRLSRKATASALMGGDPRRLAEAAGNLDLDAYPGVIGGGVVVIGRRHFEKVPMDQRFSGWGGEDISWGYALRCLLGLPRTVDAPLYHLWHPSRYVGANNGGQANTALFARYRKARRSSGAMRSLVKEAARAAHV